MDNVMTKGFCELNEQQICEIDGGLLLEVYSLVNSTVYLYDYYNYRKEVNFISGYNTTVANAGRYDLAKPSPEEPKYSIFYIFNR